jgi:hypothetical protein
VLLPLLGALPDTKGGRYRASDLGPEEPVPQGQDRSVVLVPVTGVGGVMELVITGCDDYEAEPFEQVEFRLGVHEVLECDGCGPYCDDCGEAVPDCNGYCEECGHWYCL